MVTEATKAAQQSVPDTYNSPCRFGGSVTEERVYRPFSRIALALTQPDFNAPRPTLAQCFEGGSLVLRAVEQTNAEWGGRVLLAHQKWQKKIAPRVNLHDLVSVRSGAT